MGWTLIWSGLFIFGYLGWQLFVTDLITAQVQAEAEEELDRTFEVVRTELPQVETVEVPDDPETVIEYHPEVTPTEDAEFAQMTIPVAPTVRVQICRNRCPCLLLEEPTATSIRPWIR